MTLSILIVNWKSKDYLKKCLYSISDTCRHLSPQVIVVDGGSFDGCAEMLRDDFPEVEFIQSEENIGFGRSNNLGFQKAHGEALLLLNPDTELKPGAVDALLNELRDNRSAGLVGARLLNSDGSLQYVAVHPLPTPWNAAFDSSWSRRRWWNRRGRRDTRETFEVQAVSGACMMLRASIFRKLGGFDPRFFMYAEDMDLCYRIHKLGLRILHAPHAVIIHHGGGSSSTQFSKFPAVMIREALYHFFLFNHGQTSAIAYRTLITVSALLRIPLLFVENVFSRVEGQASRKASLSKWITILSWSLGLESWASNIFAESILKLNDPIQEGGTNPENAQ